jgi:hypothetical protein
MPFAKRHEQLVGGGSRTRTRAEAGEGVPAGREGRQGREADEERTNARGPAEAWSW